MIIKKIDAKRLFVISLAAAVLHSLITIFVALVSGKVIDAVLNEPSWYATGALCIGLAYLAQVIIATANDWYSEQLTMDETRRMRDKAFAANLHKEYVGSEEAADFQTLINESIPGVVGQVYGGTKHIINCTLSVLVCSFSLLTMNWLWALIIIAASAAMVLVPRTLNKRVQTATYSFMEAVGRYNLKLQSFLGGHAIIRSFDYLYGATRQMEAACAERTEKNRTRAKYSTAVYGVSASLNLVQNASILIVGLLFILRGEITMGELVAAMQLAINICGTMEALSYYIFQRNENMPMLKKYEALLEEAEQNRSEDKGRQSVGSIRTLALQNVCFEVGGMPILKNAGITLEQGGKYLLRGESGCGKSTVLRMLAGVTAPSSGQVLVNGQAATMFNQQDYYRHVCLMPQHSYLFYATLKENILLGRDLSEAEYERLLHRANLWELAQRISNSPLDQQQLENLSGGEKQRICLARTMAGQPQVYLLDEITASLDPKNTDEIMAILFGLDATLLFVCHQPKDQWHKHWNAVYEIWEGRIIPSK